MAAPQVEALARAVSRYVYFANIFEHSRLTKGRLCGWLYFSAWSLSFYPQIILNIQRRTTQGLTPDFPLLNVFGFSCYTISTAVFLYSPVVRSQYAARHPMSPEPTVRFNDLAFGVHAWILCVVVYSQFFPRLWGWKKSPGVRRHVNKVSLGLVWGSFLAVAITIGIVFSSGNVDGTGDGRDWAWIDVVRIIEIVFDLGLEKLTQLPDLRDLVRQVASDCVQIHTAGHSKLQTEIHNRLEYHTAIARLLRWTAVFTSVDHRQCVAG